MEGVLRENAESPEGVSEGGLEAKEKLEGPEPKGADPPRVNTEGSEGTEGTEGAEGAEVAENVVGTEKVNPDDDTGAVETKLKGAAEEEAAAGTEELEAAAEVKPRFGNDAGTDGMEVASLAGWGAKEPVNRK